MNDTMNGRTYGAALACVPEYGRANVETLRAQAVAYVWGRQDAGEGVHDTGTSTDFGEAYGTHAALYSAGTIGFRRNLLDAFKLWRRGIDISDPASQPESE